MMLGGPLWAADDQLQMITATGRAVISHSDALSEAKNAALEDALYLAALSGGAKIDGFSSIQADTALDDHFVIRPSSEKGWYQSMLGPWWYVYFYKKVIPQHSEALVVR